MAAPLTLILILAVTIRAALYRSNLADLIAERVEVVSPLTAWKRGEQNFVRLANCFVLTEPGSSLTSIGNVKPVQQLKIWVCFQHLERRFCSIFRRCCYIGFNAIFNVMKSE